MRRFVLAAALAAAAFAPLSAQRLGSPEKRPRLDAGADTNDANAYFDHGMAKFERDPYESAAAFYWAARINPAWGDALYARRASLLAKDGPLLQRYMDGNKRTLESKEVRKLDSLQFRALMLSPFLYRKLDRALFVSYIKQVTTGDTRGATTPDLDYAINTYLASAGQYMRGWLSYSDGDFDNALLQYANSMKSAKDKASLRLDRARIFSMRSQVDSATAEFNLALEEMRKKDAKDLVIFYNSKALAEYSIGVLLEGNGNNAGAREAYGRALQEDLAYYPAHLRLGLLALTLKDTTTAISELALANELAPDEPHIRYVNGFVLSALGNYPGAVTELTKAIELEPFYAMPYLRLGQVYEQLKKGKEAVAAYEGFLARASATHPEREGTKERVEDVKAWLASLDVAKP